MSDTNWKAYELDRPAIVDAIRFHRDVNFFPGPLGLQAVLRIKAGDYFLIHENGDGEIVSGVDFYRMARIVPGQDK